MLGRENVGERCHIAGEIFNVDDQRDLYYLNFGTVRTGQRRFPSPPY